MEADRFNDLPIAGTYGDACVLPSTVEFDSTSNPETVDFADLPAGAEITKVEAINDALGASTTMTFGARYPDSDTSADADKYIGSTDTSSAGSAESAVHPEVLDERAIITGTLGGAAATGKVSVLVHYRFQGNE